jgi:hypothetical protein
MLNRYALLFLYLVLDYKKLVHDILLIFTRIPDGEGSNTIASCCKGTDQYAVRNRIIPPTSRFSCISFVFFFSEYRRIVYLYMKTEKREK